MLAPELQRRSNENEEKSEVETPLSLCLQLLDSKNEKQNQNEEKSEVETPLSLCFSL